MEKYRSDRYFVAFDFFTSHRQLLLRSMKDDGNSNIDIIFFDVSFIQTPTNFKGIELSKIDDPSSLSSKNILINEGSIFEIKSNDNSYYIAASIVKVYKNELEFNESSLGLFEVKGRDNEIISIL